MPFVSVFSSRKMEFLIRDALPRVSIVLTGRDPF